MANEQKQDELVTRSAAMVITWLRQNIRKEVKAAIKELCRDFGRDSAEYLLHHKWIRAVVGLLFIAGLVAAWIKEKSPG